MLLNNLLASMTRPTVASCLTSGQCTFMATGTNYQMQEVFRCVTCNLTGTQGICAVCAQKCHKGHSLIPSGRLNFYCDCNSRGCSAQSVGAPINASVQITVPGISISANPQPYPQPVYPQPQMFNPYPQPTVVHQEVHHHHVVAPPTMPTVQMTSCPACTGKGGVGAFGPCHRGDVHWRRNCMLCNGSGSVHAGYRPCNMCQAKGATGAFGPCTQEDVHFRSLCHVCNGKCYIYDTPSYPQPVYSQPVYSQPVQPVHVHHHHHGHSGNHQVTFSSHSGSSVTCPVCTGKGGIGTFGPCAKGNVHWKRNCSFCNGSGNVMSGSRPCTMCSGKGGLGTFGPCEVGSIHFKSVCNGCHGKCHVY